MTVCDRARRLVLSAPLLLAACMSPPRWAPTPPLGAAGLAAPSGWSGRFSIVLSHFDPPRQDASMGRFALHTQDTTTGATLALELTSPLGQTMARGRREANGQASLNLADGRQLQAQGLDALIDQALGWPLPIERLPQWLDDQFETILERDASGQIARASDSGWQIERAPGRWALQRPVTQGSLRVVLILDR